MEKKRSSQPVLNDDQRESSTKDLSSQVSTSHKMPGTGKEKGKEKTGMKDSNDKAKQ